MSYYSHNIKGCLIFWAITVILALLVPAEFWPARGDNLPSTAERFYGSVFNNDELVGSGYVVTALIGATKVAETVTDSQGRYGYSPVFEISASPGKMIQFSINDHPALQRAMFQGGAATELNLICYGAASQMPQTSCSGAACASPSRGISPQTLTAATAGYPYSVALSAQGGVLPYTWSISSGSLPPGLTLDGTSGVIKGVPASPQTYSFTVQVNDSASSYLTLTTSIQVKPGTASSQTASLQASTPTASLTSNFLGAADSLNVSENVLNVAREIASIDRRVRLNLAAGTLLRLQGQSVIGAGNETNPPPAGDGSVSVRSYSFNPSGATFSPAATMTLKYEAPLPPGLIESALYIAYWNGSAWIRLDSTVDIAAKEVSASVSHFTIFAVRGIPVTAAQPVASTAGSSPPPAASPASAPGYSAAVVASPVPAFAFSDLIVVPEIIGQGEKVTLSVRVLNSGDSEATREIVLAINGKDEIPKELTLGAGKSQVLIFTVSESDPGNYKVSIGGISTGFEVIKAAPSGQQSSGLSTVVVGIVAAGGLLAMIIALIGIFRRRPNS